MMNAWWTTVCYLSVTGPTAPASGAADGAAVELPAWTQPAGEAEPFELGGGPVPQVWGGGGGITQRLFQGEFLPALFERTLVIHELELKGDSARWVFTGAQGGVTITITANEVAMTQRFYDSYGLFELKGREVKAQRHPEKRWLDDRVCYQGRLQAVTLTFDDKLHAALSLNGKEVARQACLLDVSQHQLQLIGQQGRMKGAFLRPQASAATVRIDESERHQQIMGFGGITPPTAYAMLSPAGKRRWWERLAEYNLLIQREYPIGTQLNPQMDNWDVLADASPHYYGDNFPNGEISDFAYIKTLRRLGGHVLFEFWNLPAWAKQDWKDADGKVHKGAAQPQAYAKAMVEYCRASQAKAGSPPDVVGIQNEVEQPVPIWYQMALSLRQGLDQAGFKNVRIHLTDAGSLGGGLKRLEAFRQSHESWKITDYTATHMYDYQSYFERPDEFDAHLKRWRDLAAGRPFLSTELCVNSPKYQINSYRLALSMGQLYHKNMVLTDAVAICYCWTLLNVVQPSYGATRSLLVPAPALGFTPVASSSQLRVFGGFSRRVREGMVRIGAASSDPDMLVSAYADGKGRKSVVLLNRSIKPVAVRIENAGGSFQQMELVDPYHENEVVAAPAADGEALRVLIEPGMITTLTGVPLGRLPDDFRIEGLP